MKKINIVLFILFLMITIWYLYPTLVYYSHPPEKREEMVRNNPKLFQRVLNFGNPFYGAEGLRLIIQIDKPSVGIKDKKFLFNRVSNIIKSRLNSLDILNYRVKSLSNDKFEVEIPSFKDKDKAKNAIEKTDKLEFKMLLEVATLDKMIRLIDSVSTMNWGKDTIHCLDSTANNDITYEGEYVASRINQLFIGRESNEDKGKSTQTRETNAENKTIMSISFIEYLEAVGQFIGVRKCNREKIQNIIARSDVQYALNIRGFNDCLFLWGEEIVKKDNNEYYIIYFINNKLSIEGDIIQAATMYSFDKPPDKKKKPYNDWPWKGFNNETISNDLGYPPDNVLQKVKSFNFRKKEYLLKIKLRNNYKSLFTRMSANNCGKYLAIVLNNKVYAAPVISEKINTVNFKISGITTKDKVNKLSHILTAKVNPINVKIIESNLVKF